MGARVPECDFVAQDFLDGEFSGPYFLMKVTIQLGGGRGSSQVWCILLRVLWCYMKPTCAICWLFLELWFALMLMWNKSTNNDNMSFLFPLFYAMFGSNNIVMKKYLFSTGLVLEWWTGSLDRLWLVFLPYSMDEWVCSDNIKHTIFVKWVIFLI